MTTYLAPFSLDFGSGGVGSSDPFGSTASGFPTGQTNQFDLGGALDQLGDELLGAAGGLLQDYINGAFNDPAGGGAIIEVRAGAVVGLGGLYEYMKTHQPPMDTASRSDRGNWIRYAATDVLGIAQQIVWQNETTKRQTYELFRAYLAAFDRLTGGKYDLLSTIPPSEPPRYSEGEPCRPYQLYLKLQSLGRAALSAIDAAGGSQPITDGDVTTWTGQAEEDPDPGALQSLLDALNNVLNNTLQTLGTIGQSAVEGAVGGAQATSAGANAGASSARASLFASPVVLIGLVVVVVFLLRRR